MRRGLFPVRGPGGAGGGGVALAPAAAGWQGTLASQVAGPSSVTLEMLAAREHELHRQAQREVIDRCAELVCERRTQLLREASATRRTPRADFVQRGVLPGATADALVKAPRPQRRSFSSTCRLSAADDDLADGRGKSSAHPSDAASSQSAEPSLPAGNAPRPAEAAAGAPDPPTTIPRAVQAALPASLISSLQGQAELQPVSISASSPARSQADNSSVATSNAARLRRLRAHLSYRGGQWVPRSTKPRRVVFYDPREGDESPQGAGEAETMPHEAVFEQETAEARALVRSIEQLRACLLAEEASESPPLDASVWRTLTARDKENAIGQLCRRAERLFEILHYPRFPDLKLKEELPLASEERRRAGSMVAEAARVCEAILRTEKGDSLERGLQLARTQSLHGKVAEAKLLLETAVRRLADLPPASPELERSRKLAAFALANYVHAAIAGDHDDLQGTRFGQQAESEAADQNESPDGEAGPQSAASDDPIFWIARHPAIHSIAGEADLPLQTAVADAVRSSWPTSKLVVQDEIELQHAAPAAKDGDEPASYTLLRVIINALVHDKASMRAMEVLEVAKAAGVRDLVLESWVLQNVIEQRGILENRAVRRFLDDLARAAAARGVRPGKSRRRQRRAQGDLIATAYARLGEEGKALEALARMGELPNDDFVRMIRMQAASARGDLQSILEETMATYDVDLRHDDWLGSTPAPPQPVFVLGIQAAARSDQVDAAERIFDVMLRAGYGPTREVHSSLFAALLRQGNIERAVEHLDQQYDLEGEIGQHFVSSLIAQLAHRRDVEAVSWLLALLRNRGVELDVVSYTSIMKVFVEAQMFVEALRMFESITKSSSRTLHPDTACYNVALAALGESNASPATLLAHVEKMREEGYNPTSRTYTSLLDYLCTQHALEDAEDAFHQMQEEGIRPTAHHYSILIRAFLMRHLVADADFYWLRMQEQGIENSPHIWTIFEKAARKIPLPVLQQESGQLASILRGLGSPDVARDSEHEPDLSTSEINFIDISNVLLQYRRSGLHQELLHLWRKLFAMVVWEDEKSMRMIGRAAREAEFRRRALRSDLCVPLSIVIDSLSEAGMHSEVAQIWGQVRRAGYGFNAHNWNHLAVALVRAERFEDAFRIVENVLVDSQAFSGTARFPTEDRERALFDAATLPARAMPIMSEPDFSARAHALEAWRPHLRTIATIEPLINRLRRGGTLPRTKPSTMERDDTVDTIDIGYMQQSYPRTLAAVDRTIARQGFLDSQKARSDEISAGKIA